ncbi:MAG: hypothetical protein MI739_02980 [Bacteroidales bacterium]|nr:hypothetical protein [Bacteroidales bacterium]
MTQTYPYFQFPPRRISIEETQNGFGLVEIPSKCSGMVSILSKSHRRDSE